MEPLTQRIFCTLLLLSVGAQCQDSFGASEPATSGSANSEKQQSDYVIGPDDQLNIVVPDSTDEIGGRSVRVDGTGSIRLPLIGEFKVSSMTVRQLESTIRNRLTRYMNNPEVIVTVTEYRSQPVSILGAVNTPGVQLLRGPKTLTEMISMAGGLRQDAGHIAKVTRRKESGPLPVDGATVDESGGFTVAKVDLQSIMAGDAPEKNILVRPHDLITIPRGEMVYVVGEVERSGGFVLNERTTMSVLEALSMAGGLKPTAAAKNARLLRAKPGEPARAQVELNVAKILNGKAKDSLMQPDDILFIPGSASRKTISRAAEALVQTVTGIAIWRSAR